MAYQPMRLVDAVLRFEKRVTWARTSSAPNVRLRPDSLWYRVSLFRGNICRQWSQPHQQSNGHSQTRLRQFQL
eukprot:scaffold921_cov397-Prasinococcus_capsulatus_cf.AAC.9